jgi:CHAT domain-containing protein
MAYWDSLSKNRLSIYWGKQAANLYLGFQKRLTDPQLLRHYFESNKVTYRNLAHALIGFARLSEARQVLNILKKEEYLYFIRGDRSYLSSFAGRLDFTQLENHWLQKYESAIETLAKISNEHHGLKLKKNKNYAEKSRIKYLESRLAKAHKSYEKFFIQLESAFEQFEKDKKAMKEDLETLEKRATALKDTLKYLDETEGGKNAAIHFLVYEGRISAIITSPDSPPILKQWQVDKQELNKTVLNYITFIMKSGEKVKGVQLIGTPTDSEKKRQYEILNEMLQYEKKLYDLTFKQVDEELKKYGATNLTISLDGVLRYIPFGALWDGENYLIQRYRMALITPTSLKNIKDAPVEEKKILGFGASRGGEGFTPLPNVGREIRSIVKDEEKGYYGLIPGKGFMMKQKISCCWATVPPSD